MLLIPSTQNKKFTLEQCSFQQSQCFKWPSRGWWWATARRKEVEGDENKKNNMVLLGHHHSTISRVATLKSLHKISNIISERTIILMTPSTGRKSVRRGWMVVVIETMKREGTHTWEYHFIFREFCVAL